MEVVKSSFTDDIYKLLDESKTGFENIKGEEQEGWTTTYETSFCMINAYYCLIRDNILSNEYVAVFVTWQTEEDVKKQINQLSGAVGSALDNDYYYCYNETLDGIEFTKGTDIGVEDKSIIEVKSEKSGDKYNLVLILKEPELIYWQIMQEVINCLRYEH